LSNKELRRTLRSRCSRSRSCRTRSRGPGNPPIKNPPPGNCYCRKVWPGGYVCIPKDGPQPDPQVWGAVSAATVNGGGGAPTDCYPPKGQAANDITGSGSIVGDLGARGDANAGITDATLQELGRIDAAEAKGNIDAATAEARREAAIIRGGQSPITAAGPAGESAHTAGTGTTGIRGGVLDAKTLDGMCNQPPSGPVFCRIHWPGGFTGAGPNGGAPGPGWIPAKEERATQTVTDPRTGKTATVTVSRLVKADECFPQKGEAWWSTGGAYVVRVLEGAGREISKGVARELRLQRARIRALASLDLAKIASVTAAEANDAEVDGAGGKYCRTTWPGGLITVPPGGAVPQGPWAPTETGVGKPCYQV
jgi:hypothetical protein